MKTLNTIFTAMAMLALVCTPLAYAADPAVAPEKSTTVQSEKKMDKCKMDDGRTAEECAKELADKLNLTDIQRGQILAIYQDDARRLDAVPADQRCDKALEFKQASEAAIMAILNLGQQKKYEELLRDQEKAMMMKKADMQKPEEKAAAPEAKVDSGDKKVEKPDQPALDADKKPEVPPPAPATTGTTPPSGTTAPSGTAATTPAP